MRPNPQLTQVARDYSQQMVRRNFFSHTSPSGENPADRVRAVGLTYWMVGENLFQATNAPDLVPAAVEGWMNSPGHRENLLQSGYTETGVGIWREDNTYYYETPLKEVRMTRHRLEEQVKYLAFLRRSRRKAVIAMGGSLLAALCLMLLVYFSERTPLKEQFEDDTRIDLVGVLLAASAFVTLVGGSLSAWLVFDTASEYRRLSDTRQDADQQDFK